MRFVSREKELFEWHFSDVHTLKTSIFSEKHFWENVFTVFTL